MDELERLFTAVKEEGQRTFGTASREVCVAHHALRRRHLRWSASIIDLFYAQYVRRNPEPGFTKWLARLHAALQTEVTPLAV